MCVWEGGEGGAGIYGDQQVKSKLYEGPETERKIERENKKRDREEQNKSIYFPPPPPPWLRLFVRRLPKSEPRIYIYIYICIFI